MIIILICIFLIILCYFIEKDRFSPASIYNTIFITLILCAYIFISKNYIWNGEGIYWMLASCFIFTIGSIIAKKIPIKAGHSLRRSEISNVSWGMMILFILLGLIKCWYEISSSGFDLSIFTDFSLLLDANATMANNRYFNDQSINMIVQILNVFVYVAPLCGGYSFNLGYKKIHKIICISSFIPIIISVVFTNAKAGFIAAIMLFFIGLLTASLYNHKQSLKLNKSLIMKLFLTFIFVLFLVYISFVLRIGEFTIEAFSIINDKIIVYAFGSIHAFDTWYSNFFEVVQLGLGKYTFLSIADLLGIAERVSGVYPMIAGSPSNVFTSFRSLIEDFGPTLSLIVMLFFSTCMNYVHLRLQLSNKRMLVLQTVYAMGLFYIFYAFIISAWAYTSFILIFPVFFLYLLATNLKIKFVIHGK